MIKQNKNYIITNALHVRLIECGSKTIVDENDIVLDPFSGTFTTSFVAKKFRRSSIGIELHEEYAKIGLRRLSLQEKYRGEKLQKELRSFEKKYDKQEALALFA